MSTSVDRAVFNDSLQVTRGLMLRAREIDLRAAESDNSEDSHEVLFRAIRKMLEDARAAMGRISARFDEAADEPEWAKVADIAGLAGIALRERVEVFAHRAPCDHWTFVELCESALRSVWKATTVLEGALMPHGDTPARLLSQVELDKGLAIRNRYARLRRECMLAGAGSEDPQQRLRAVSRSIASLLAGDEYATMRLGDRRSIRKLQFRIQSWLSLESPDEITGTRLWQEVGAVTNLLYDINHRFEILEHDTSVLALLVETVSRWNGLAGVRQQAAALSGLDPELDQLLDVHNRDSDRCELWARAVSRLAFARGLGSTTDFSTTQSHAAEV